MTLNKAWLFGFFMNNGSALFDEVKLVHKSLTKLQRAKNIVTDEFNIQCDIKNHLTSSDTYELVVKDAEFTEHFSKEFYTSYRYKKVPELILNSSIEIKKHLLMAFAAVMEIVNL